MRRRLALAVAYAAVVSVVFVPPVRTVALAVGLVPELVNLPVRPLTVFAPEPIRVTTTYGEPADRLDIYIPRDALPDHGTPSVLLELGVHPQPIDDPSVVAIATAMARCGVIVGVPDSAALRELRITPAEPAHLADAALVLAARSEADANGLGLAGFSAGASMALMAAADPRLNGRIKFVSEFGGYADAMTLLEDVATRTMLLEGIQPWEPDAGIRHDVAVLLARAIEPDEEGGHLESVLTSVTAMDVRQTTPDPAIVAGLQGDAKVAYLLFTAPSRLAAPEIVGQFSSGLERELQGISPASVAPTIGGRIFILHGAGDTAIPVSHAYSLANRITPVRPHGFGDPPMPLPTNVAKFTIFGQFGHGQPGQSGLSLDDAGDIWELTLYLHDIIAAATE